MSLKRGGIESKAVKKKFDLKLEINLEKKFKKKSCEKKFKNKISGKKFGKKILNKSFDKKNSGKINYKT